MDHLADSMGIREPAEPTAPSSTATERLRLVLLGLLGYGVLGGVLVLVLAILAVLAVVLAKLHAGWLVLKLAWLPLVVAGVVLRALWVTIPERQGLVLDRERFSALFDMVDSVSLRLRTPPVHRVVLTREINASMSQVPRLGVFGWPRNTLTLGLPLLMVLRPESLTAVVGHELGHLSRNHGAFGAWIYRVRQTWQRVLEGLMEGNAKIDFGLREFFHWYVPYFEACSFRLRRAQEFVADACAAEVTSTRQACETLLEVELMSQFAQSVMNRWANDLLRHEAEPPLLLCRMREQMWKGPTDLAAARGLGDALRREPSSDDTHPSLSARLLALDEGFMREVGVSWPTAGWAARSERSAADTFLGPELAGVIEHFDRQWREENRLAWDEQHREIQQRLRDLDELDRAARERELTKEESSKLVSESIELRDPETALQVVRPFALTHSEVPQARFALGQLLLFCRDEAGIAEIEAAMAIDPRSIAPGCELIEGYLCGKGPEADLAGWRERARTLLARTAERKTLEEGDELLPHGLDEETRARLRKLFEQLPLQAVMLARKKVEHFPDYPVWILGYSVRTRSGQRGRRALEDAVGQHLRQALSEVGDLILFPLERRPSMIDALGAVESSIVYDE